MALYLKDSVAMKVTFSKPVAKAQGVVVAVLDEGAKLPESLATLDKRSGGHIGRAMKIAKFEGKKDQSLDLVSPTDGVERLILVGAGKVGSLEPREVELLGGAIVGMLQAAKCKKGAVVALPSSGKGRRPSDVAALIASGAKLRHYSFDGYKTKKSNGNGLESLVVSVSDVAGANRAFVKYAAIAEGNHFARNLVNEPANILTPIEFANRAKTLSKAGVKIEILTPTQMKKLGMHALLGVALGSPHEARLVVMRWNGGKKGVRPVAFVGKGVTFDTGGVSIKPAGGMEDMKGDMAGAACVTGLMLALAKRKAKVNAIGAIGIVENAIDGNAQRPGDVVKSMSGQTIAVLNTDAEGRLVLADVLWYVQKRFNPQFMVNLATLTGAILVALGKEHAGLFSNNDELAVRLTASGLVTGEKVWRMPLTPEYDKMIDHDVADMKNIGGRHAGSITAAQFLQRFVNNVPWAHLDVAGTAMDSVKSSINQSWASGWGVRLLNNLVESHYEK
jgi:leucyl aminopeptidase